MLLRALQECGYLRLGLALLTGKIPTTQAPNGVGKWTYEIFWGTVAVGPAGALSGELDLDTLLALLGGGYTIGDVFAPVQ